MNKIDNFNTNLGKFARAIMEIIEYSSDIQNERNLRKLELTEIIKNIKVEIEELNSKNQKVKLITKHETFIDKMTFVYIASKFEAFLNDVFLNLIELYSKCLISDKQISHKKILEYENLNEFKNDIRKEMLEEFSFASFSDKMKIINTKFNIDLTETIYHKSIIEILTSRNIILHNDSKVNETFNKFNSHLNLNIDFEIIINSAKIRFYSMCLIEFSIVLINKIENKINK